MPVSSAELRLLITAQDRAKQVVADAAATIGRVTQAVNQLGQARGFQTAAQGATIFGREVRNIQNLAPFERMILQAKQFSQAAQQAAMAARQVSTASAGGGNNLGGIGSALSNIQAAFRNAQQAASQASGAISQSLMAIGNAARGVAGGVSGGLSAAFNGLQSLVGGITGVAGRIGELVRSAGGLGAASNNVNTFSSSLRNMVALGATIVGLNSAITLLQRVWEGFTDAAIGFNSVLENTQNAFTSLFRGDAEKAAAFIQQLRQVAESTAFEFPDLLKMSQQLIGVGLAAEQVIPLMKDVAGAMTAAGRTTADINRVSRALQQIFTTGRVQADEMNQLAEAGVPGWRILGQAIQQSGESIESAIGRARELGKQGKISAADFFNAFQQFSRQEGWREMAENAVNTFTGAVSNLKDSFRFLVSDATQPAFLAMSAGIQNFSKLLMSAPIRQFALNIGATMKDVIANFSTVGDAFKRVFEGFRTEGISGALQAIVAEFANLAGGMQSAGAQLMQEYASGIIQGASDLIQGAVEFVADLIASFLIGSSPPPSGPLSNIDQGGRNVATAWLAGLSEGFRGVEQVVVGVADAFGNINEQLSLSQVEGAFEGAKGNLAALTAVAEDAEGAIRSLGASQRELDREQGALTTQIENIKSGYDEQIDGLERSIAAIKTQNTEAERYADLVQRQNDAISKQADLRDRAALNELKAAEIAAEGDPVKRAQLVAEQATLKAQEQDLQMAQRAHDLAQRQEALDKRRADGKKTMSATDQRDIELAQQRINLDMRQLETERKLAGLTDKQALANIEARRSEIERAAALRRVEEDRARMATEGVKSAAEIERAQKEILALPLEQQLEAIKQAQEDQLRPLQRRLESLQQEERALQAIRKEWQGIKADIDDAARAQKAVETAAKGGAGKGPGFAGGPLTLDRQDIDVGALAERVGSSFASKFGEAFGARIGPIIFGVLGAVAGGSLFGPLGLAAGALFGAQVGASVQQQVPNLTTIFADAGRTFLQAFAGEWSGTGDEWISPLVRAAGMLGIAFKATADVVAAAWEAMRGPVGAAMEFIRQNTGLVAAALTGLLVPAFAGLLGVAMSALTPIVALLAPLTPAMLAVSAAAVALKLAWDANFGGIRDTTMAALPGIVAAFQMLGQAFLLLTQGDAIGALQVLGAALEQFGAAVTPILTGIGQAIWEQTKAWASALWEWISESTPQALAALADFANATVAWIGQNAEPMLRAFLEWGQAFVAWVGPMIPPAIVALGTLIDNILTWIGAQIPPLLQAVTKWAVIFVGWIVTDVIPQLPGLLAMLGETIIAGIVTLVPRVAQAVLDIAVAIGTGFMEGLAVAAPGMHQALLDLWAGAVAAWTSAVATVQTVVDTIVAAWNTLPGLLQAIWDAITGGVAATLAAIQAAWDAGWQAVLSVWNAVGAALSSAVMAVWNSLDADTQASLMRMVTAITALWDSLVALAQTIWAAIVAVWTLQLGVITTVVQAFITGGQAAWQAYATYLETLWNGLAAIATATWTLIVNAITAVVEPWWATFRATWELIKQTVIAVWEWLSTNVGPVVQRVIDAIMAVFETFKTTLTNTVTTWKEMGMNLASGLMEAIRLGINQKVRDVAGAISGAVETLTGIIDKALGRTNSSGGGGVGIDMSGTYQQAAVSAAKKYGLPPELFLAQLQQESGFNPDALSPAGARGIAQFMPGTGSAVATRMGVDPAKFWADVGLQIEGAAFHMRELVDQFGDYDRALAAYNAGSGAVQRYGGVPPFAETQKYVNTINATAGNIKVPAMPSMGAGVQGDPGRGLQVIRQKQGEWAAQLADAGTICGPYLAALFADAVGRPPSPEEARAIGEAMGVYGRGQGILAAGRFGEFATNVVQQFNPGTTARVQQTGVSGPWEAGQMAQQALGAGAPLVGFNTPRHYFGATAFDPATQKFNTGGTGRVFGNEDPWLTAQQIAEMGGGITHIITLAGQMGEGFTVAGQQATAAMEATGTTVETAGATVERTAQAASIDSATLVTTSTDALGNVTTLYQDATGVIGASITNASGQVVNAWGLIAQAHQSGAASQQAAAEQAQAFANQLTAGMVPAGAEAGTAIQQMTDDINPLLAEIAAGSLTTDQLVMKLGALALNAGLTSEPLTGMAAGTTTAQQAMLQLFTAAAAVDPQFATLATTMQTTNADAQTMAVTFAEGVAGSVGVASAAIGAMQTSIGPLVQAVDEGSISGASLEATIVQMADAAGLATAPFRQMRDGVIDSNQALEDVIALSADVGPEFATLAEEVRTAGTVSQEAAKRYLELIRAFRQGAVPSDQAAEGAQTIGQTAEQAVEPIAQLSNTMVETATAGAEAFQNTLVTGVQSAIESVRGEAGNAETAGNEVGSAIVRGMESGISSAAESVASRAAEVVRGAIEAARSAADAHSPSNETMELGYHMDAGLEIGQIEDSRYVEEASRGVVAAALDAMRDEADAHSPSGEGVRIGQDIMKGLVKGLNSMNLSDVARQQIQEYIDIAGDFDDAFAKVVDIDVARLQHNIAGAQRDTLSATLAVADAQEAIEKAARGTYEQQMQVATLQYLQAETQKRIAEAAQADLDTQNRLRDVEQERERIAAGSLADREQLASLNAQMAGIAAQQADLDLRSAQAAQESLAVRQQLASVEAERQKAQQGSLEDQLRQAEIGRRNAELGLQQLQADRELLPIRAEARDLQRQIEAATKGTVEAQQAQIRADAAHAANRIEQLRIQQQLADAEETGGGLTQEQINALHEQDRALQKQGETNARQAEIDKLQAQIATAADRERLVALQDQITQREEALLPVQDEKALLDNENAIIRANNELVATAYDGQIVQLQSQVASHDAIALQMENERAILEAQTAVLAAQQGVITATNEASAAALDVQIVRLQEAVNQVNMRQQAEQDILDRLQNQQAVIEATTAYEATKMQGALISAQQRQEAEQGTLRAMERQLEYAQATASVISTQVALANALKAALEAAGAIRESNSSSGSKKRKKKASGGPVYEDDIVLVGEMGREIFVPPEDGYILNNATTERLMSSLDVVSPRIDSVVRQRQVGGSVWGGRSYLVGEGSGVEGYSQWSPSGGDPGYTDRPVKMVNATIHYHVHERQRSGEASVQRVVLEAIQYAINTG